MWWLSLGTFFVSLILSRLWLELQERTRIGVMKNSSHLFQFTEACMALATRQVRPSSSKFSQCTFTRPQLVVLYCLKLGVTYRELGDWLEEMPRIRETLGLKQLPYFPTEQKAFQRLSTAIWGVLQRLSASLTDGGRRGGF